METECFGTNENVGPRVKRSWIHLEFKMAPTASQLARRIHQTLKFGCDLETLDLARVKTHDCSACLHFFMAATLRWAIS